MNRQQMLDALAAGEKPIDVAIRKWEDIANGEGEDHGSTDCAICKVQWDTHEECAGCPTHSEDKGCCDGLYSAYVWADTPQAKNSAALDMVRYLKQKKQEIEAKR